MRCESHSGYRPPAERPRGRDLSLRGRQFSQQLLAERGGEMGMNFHDCIQPVLYHVGVVG